MAEVTCEPCGRASGGNSQPATTAEAKALAEVHDRMVHRGGRVAKGR